MPPGDRRVEPSAPPIHMMPGRSGSEDRDQRDRSPPPRYEEAIASNNNSGGQLLNITSGQASSGSQHHYQSLRSRPSRRSASCNPTNGSSPSASPSSGRIRGLTTSTGPGSASGQDQGARFRSASPGYLSECSDENHESAEPKRKKKRGSGSKIKKGLENIAFFIIQILD